MRIIAYGGMSLSPEPNTKKGAGTKGARKAGKGAGARPRGGGPKARKGRRLSGKSGARADDGACGVPGCDKESERSISFRKAKDAMEDWKLDKGPRRIHVCKDHYREFKKATKRDRDIDRAGWMERTGRLDGRK
jgi:hypothetical protein